MKTRNWIAVCLFLIFVALMGGALLGNKYKKCSPCPSADVRVDTVWIPGKTITVEKPAVKRSYSAEKLKQKLFVSGKDTADHFTNVSKMVNPCDSIRIYEYSDSAVTIKDSIQGVLLQQTVIHKQTIREIRTVQVKKDTAVFKSGFYLGGSAGINSIRIEGEYLTKKGWGYSAGYDILNKSPIVGIKRKIF